MMPRDAKITADGVNSYSSVELGLHLKHIATCSGVSQQHTDSWHTDDIEQSDRLGTIVRST
jgi:hypothetical protein